jgi:diguanylate cyclase (GGDEF)-like protein
VPRALSLVLPEGLVVLAAVLLARFGGGVEGYAQVAEWLPPMVLLAGAAIGWRYRRGRTLSALAFLAVAWAWVVGGAPFELRPGLAVASGLVLIAVGVFRERGFSGPYTWALVAGVLLFAAWTGLVTMGYPTRAAPPIAGPLSWTGLPGPEAVALLLPILVLLVTSLIRADGLAQGALWATVALWGVLVVEDRTEALILVAGGAGAIVAGTLESIFSAAYRDALTGLPSRRALDERMAALPAGAVVAMVDVDHFKLFNDSHGHETGDQVLRMVAWRLAEVRDGEAYRYGGEEFTLIFQGLPPREALARLEQGRAAVAANRFTVRSADRPRGKTGKTKRARDLVRHGLSVTVSIGVAVRGEGETPAAVIRRADEALYAAKEAGRDRVLVAKG